MKQALLKVVNALCIVIIVLAVVVMLRAVFVPSGEVPTVGGYGVMRVLTGSMEPDIPTNSVIVVHSEDTDTLEVGDIISFYSSDPDLGGSVVTHRISAIDEDESTGERLFTTKGDANSIEDENPVPAADVVGKVVFVSGVLGLIVSLLSNPLVFVPVVLIPLVIVLILEIRKTIKTAQEIERQENEEALREAVRELKAKRAAEKDAAAQDAGVGQEGTQDSGNSEE